jgi:spermidine synthase
MYKKIVQTKLQQIHLESSEQETLLYLDSDLQFSSLENHLYDSALIAPALEIFWKEKPLSVLILWGGDWLLAHALFENFSIDSIEICEIDSEMIEFCKTELPVTRLNGNVFTNPKLHITIWDAFEFVQQRSEKRYNMIIADFPDPHFPILSKLYCREFYTSIRNMLSWNGIFTTIACEVHHTKQCYQNIGGTLASVFNETCWYSVAMPKSYGNIGLYTASMSAYKWKLSKYAHHPIEARGEEINTFENMNAYTYFKTDTEKSQFIPGITNR